MHGGRRKSVNALFLSLIYIYSDKKAMFLLLLADRLRLQEDFVRVCILDILLL